MVDALVSKDPKASAPVAAQSSVAAPSADSYENLKVSMENGVCKIMMNRPHKKNALNREVGIKYY